jgi:glycerophosphoryl diester phosphodiesterase
MGSDFIETDIRFTKDLIPVLIHSSDVSVVSNGVGQVNALSLKELCVLDAGSRFGEKFRGERIPTLLEVMEWSKGKIGLMLDIKEPGNNKLESILRMVADQGMLDQVIVASFELRVLDRAKNYSPNINTSFLVHDKQVHLIADLDESDPVDMVQTSQAN